MGARGTCARTREMAALAGLYALVAGAPIPRFWYAPTFSAQEIRLLMSSAGCTSARSSVA